MPYAQHIVDYYTHRARQMQATAKARPMLRTLSEGAMWECVEQARFYSFRQRYGA